MRPTKTARTLEKLAKGVSRLGVVYSGLYCASNPQVVASLLGGGMGHRPAAAERWSGLWAMPELRRKVAERVFRTTVRDDFEGGDNRYAWVGQFCTLGAAAAITPVWATLDRRGTSQAAAEPWIRSGLRLSLAAQMLYYGAAKVIPLQFQTPLIRMVEPVGQLTPMELLWVQSGHSRPYQILLGAAEITGGLLLLSPVTGTAGALLSSFELSQVLLLNLTFDVPVKLHSSHLLLLSAVLLEPEARRLGHFFLSPGAAGRPAPQRLFARLETNRLAETAQIAAGLALLARHLRRNQKLWKQFGGGQDKPELYGVWEVEEFAVDGTVRPALASDPTRWRRLVLDLNNLTGIQYMDDHVVTRLAQPDLANGSLTLIDPGDPGAITTLSLHRPAPDRLELEGEKVRIRLRRADLEQFPLISRGFHWVQEQSSLR